MSEENKQTIHPRSSCCLLVIGIVLAVSLFRPPISDASSPLQLQHWCWSDKRVAMAVDVWRTAGLKRSGACLYRSWAGQVAAYMHYIVCTAAAADLCCKQTYQYGESW